MPGKVNPVIPEVVLQVAAQVIGNDAAITIAGTQGNFELNVRVPVIARNLLDSITILSSAATMLAEKCVDGLEANEENLTRARGVHAGHRHRAEPLHRLRPGHRDRQGGGGLRAHDPRGGDREGRGRGDAGRGAGPAQDGARLGRLTAAADSSASWSSLSSSSAAAQLASRCSTLLVPGIGSITGETCSSQAERNL